MSTVDSQAAAATEAVPGYQELVPIGTGRYGVSYRARHEQPDRLVALKVLGPGFTGTRQRRQFLREAQHAAELPTHPNVVGVLDSGVTASGRPYVAMEYFPDGSLNDRLSARGPLPADDVVRVGVAVCAALDGPHRDGRAHGNIKPQNVFLRPDGGPALAGFDTGLLPPPDGANRGASYTAPEVLGGAAPSPQSDVFSLGATLYHLLTGRPAYQSDDGNVAMLLLRMLDGQPAPITRADVPAHVRDAITRAMATDPAQRFADVRAFTDALRLPPAAVAETPLRQHLDAAAPVPLTMPPAPATATPLRQHLEAAPAAPVALPPPPAFVPPATMPPAAAVPQVAAAQSVATPEERQLGQGDEAASASAVPWPAAEEEDADTTGAAATAVTAARGLDLALAGSALPDPEAGGPDGPPVSRRRVPMAIVLVSVALIALATPVLLATRSQQNDQAAAPGPAVSGPAQATLPATAPLPSTAADQSGPAAPAPTGVTPSQALDVSGARPTDVTVVDGGTSVSLHWVLAPGTEKRNIIIQQAPTDPGRSPLTVLEPGATSYTATGLNAATGYCFLVGVFFAAGTGTAPATVARAAPVCIRGAVASGT